MKNVQISDRLKAVAAMVSQGNRIADVGCDHGYIPVYLLQQERIPSAIAMDVNKGPLQRAEEHIRQYGLEAFIETRLSDGVRALQPEEADTVIVAGMGGPLMEKILTEGRDVLKTVKELILQPQSELGHFRHFLHENGYRIVEEDMILEDGKFYPMMKVVHGEEIYKKEAEYLYGSLLMKEKNPVLKRFLEKELASVSRIAAHLEDLDSCNGKERREELLKILTCIQQALSLYE